MKNLGLLIYILEYCEHSSKLRSIIYFYFAILFYFVFKLNVFKYCLIIYFYSEIF